jgi:hypothetical protein
VLTLPLVVVSLDFIPPERIQRKHRNFVRINSHSVECCFKFLFAQIVPACLKRKLSCKDFLDVPRYGDPLQSCLLGQGPLHFRVELECKCHTLTNIFAYNLTNASASLVHCKHVDKRNHLLPQRTFRFTIAA